MFKVYFYYQSAFIYNISYISSTGFTNISINHTNSQAYIHDLFAHVLTLTILNTTNS